MNRAESQEFSWARFWAAILETFHGDPEYWMRHFPLVDIFTMLSWRNAAHQDEIERHRYKAENIVEHHSLESLQNAMRNV